MSCGQCGNTGCNGCGALTVPEGPMGLTGATGAAGADGADGADGAPGYLAFSWSAGGASPFILAGTAAGRTAAYILFPGVSNYPALLALQRIRCGAYGTAGGPNFNVYIRDTDNGNAIVAQALNQTNAVAGDFFSMTINPANLSTTPVMWDIFIVDNNLSTDKVNLQSLTLEW